MPRFLVTGGTGMVGKALQQLVVAEDPGNQYVFIGSKDCDLTEYWTFRGWLDLNGPFDGIVHLAAAVGGLYKNESNNLEMFQRNCDMNRNVLRAAHDADIETVVSCLSTCVFPDDVEYPLREENLHEGNPHRSNYGYAYAKRLAEIESRLYRENEFRNYVTLAPTNLYGIHDNFSLENGHVIPSLVHRAVLAEERKEHLTVRGSGQALRQFMSADRFARILYWRLHEKNPDVPGFLVCTGNDPEYSVREVAEKVAAAAGCVEIAYDHFYNDGQLRKTASNALLQEFYPWSLAPEDFDGRIAEVVQWFKKNRDSVRI